MRPGNCCTTTKCRCWCFSQAQWSELGKQRGNKSHGNVRRMGLTVYTFPWRLTSASGRNWKTSKSSREASLYFMSAHGMPKTLPPLLRKESHLRVRLCSPSAQAEGCSWLLWTCQLPTPTSGSTSENEGPFFLLLVLEQGRKFIYTSNSCWSSLTAFYSLLLCHREEITQRTQFNPYWSNLTTSPDKNCCQNKKNKEN